MKLLTVLILLAWDCREREEFYNFFWHWYILALFNEKLLFLLYLANTWKILLFQKEGVKEGKKEGRVGDKVKMLRFSNKKEKLSLPVKLNLNRGPSVTQRHLPIPELVDSWHVLTNSIFSTPVCSPSISSLYFKIWTIIHPLLHLKPSWLPVHLD